MILYPNPDFTKAIETYGADYLPADHPNQYIAYLYNSQTEEMLPFSPADLGYEENMHMDLVPREEIVPLDDIGKRKMESPGLSKQIAGFAMIRSK